LEKPNVEGEEYMPRNLERSATLRPIYKEASRIIGENEGTKLSEETLLQLRRVGLRLIPHLNLKI